MPARRTTQNKPQTQPPYSFTLPDLCKGTHGDHQQSIVSAAQLQGKAELPTKQEKEQN